jgi:hypothetical protein
MHIELMDTIGRKERDAKLKELEKCGVFALSEFWLVETTEPDGGWHVYGAIRGPHLRMLLGGFYGLDDIRLSQVKVTHA